MELFNGLLAGNHWGTQRVCVCPAALRGGQILLLWAAGSLSSRIVNTFFSSLLLLAIALPWTARAEVKLGRTRLRPSAVVHGELRRLPPRARYHPGALHPQRAARPRHQRHGDNVQIGRAHV